MRIFTNNIRNFLSIAVIITAIVVGVSAAQAATVTNANAYPSTLQTSQAANYTVTFTTPSGVSEGETITIGFDSSFTTSSITEDDVDITDDGIELTTAANCSGSEQTSITIASDTITITICSGNGGAIAATSVISVEVGTNATSSGTGSNQATNPSNTATYYISIAGTFGDSGSIALPMAGDDTITVSAEVPQSGGGAGGSSDDGIGDTTAPTISNILVSEVTTTAATISWDTDESADSAVDYGLTESFELGTVSDETFESSHSIGLTGLTEGERYYFQVRSSDENSNETTSETQTFSTLDETAPAISDIEVVDITTQSARVTWITDELSNSIVYYGESIEYNVTTTATTLVTSHSVTLTGLTEGTDYYFQIFSTDSSSNIASSQDLTFSTDEDDSPTNVSSLIIVEDDTQLTLTWTNPDDDDLAGIKVLQCTDEYPDSPTDADCTTATDALAQSLDLTGLSNGTIYYYGVFAYDEAGQFASGALVEGSPSAPEEEVPSKDPSDDAGPGGEEVGEPVEDDSTDDTSEEDFEDSSGGEADTCGDNVCSGSESVNSCPVDCPADEEETSTLGAVEGDLEADISYLVAEDQLALEATDSGVVDVLPTSTLSVTIESSELSDDVSMVQLIIGTETYLMAFDDALALYSAEVTTPDILADYQVTVLATDEGGSTQSVSSFLSVDPQGHVYEDIDGEEVAVANAVVTLFVVVEGERVVWDGSPYGQFNPTISSSEGTFAWYVPDGDYIVVARLDGYEDSESGALTVTNSIVNPTIVVVMSIEEKEEIIADEAEPEDTGGFVETITTTINIVLDVPVVETVTEALETIREIPGVEEAAEVSVPALALTAGVSVVVMSIAFDFLPFLQYFFTAPVLFFWRRKRKEYGVVYNAISKTPVDLAVVRLFQFTAQDEAAGSPGRLVKSRVTDKGGRYFFLVDPGRYRIAITKTGFQFPSGYMKGEKIDGKFVDVYHGEAIEVRGREAVITANIPMDPSQAEKFQAPTSIIWHRRLRAIQHGLALTGVITAVVFAVIRPTIFSVAMIVIQVLVYLLARRLAKPFKPISWGIVYDKETGRPLSRVVARIFEPKYNKVLETQVTDSKGRYAFMLGPNQYYATFKKDGFIEREIRPIDYTDFKEPRGFSEEIALESQE